MARLVEARMNGAAVKFGGRKLLAYRVERRPWWQESQIHMAHLDSATSTVTPHSDRWLKIETPQGLKGASDPRWFTHRGRLYLSWTDSGRMGLSQIDPEDNVMKSFYLPEAQGSFLQKNWIFFSIGGVLYAKIWTDPHMVLEFDRGLSSVVDCHTDHWNSPWVLGEPHGGTTPVLWKGQLISLFHSYLNFSPTRRSVLYRYYVGAMAFDPVPPFKVRRCSLRPLLTGRFEAPTEDRPSAHAVVFPTSLLPDGQGFEFWFGYNDRQLARCHIPARLLDSVLQPLPSRPALKLGLPPDLRMVHSAEGVWVFP